MIDRNRIIKSFEPFEGQHCETTATGCLLNQIGVFFSEPMLFGLGEGLGFNYWNTKTRNFPFLDGKIKAGLLTQNIARNLKLKLVVQETSSTKKAWENVKININAGMPVGLKLDCYYLDYFSKKFNYAAHYVAIYGYDENDAYLVDTKQQGGKVKTSLKNLELARNEKGLLSSRNLSYIILSTDKKQDVKKAIINAIHNNAKDYLTSPTQNNNYKGILKTSIEIKKWFNNSKNIERDFKMMAKFIEKGGTGGALFRNLYRDFLKESYELLNIKQVKESYEMFCDIAKSWNEISKLFNQAGKTKDIKFINDASETLVNLSNKEKLAMEILLEINVKY